MYHPTTISASTAYHSNKPAHLPSLPRIQVKRLPHQRCIPAHQEQGMWSSAGGNNHSAGLLKAPALAISRSLNMLTNQSSMGLLLPRPCGLRPRGGLREGSGELPLRRAGGGDSLLRGGGLGLRVGRYESLPWRRKSGEKLRWRRGGGDWLLPGGGEEGGLGLRVGRNESLRWRRGGGEMARLLRLWAGLRLRSARERGAGLYRARGAGLYSGARSKLGRPPGGGDTSRLGRS
jgi:hypothetical protein